MIRYKQYIVVGICVLSKVIALSGLWFKSPLRTFTHFCILWGNSYQLSSISFKSAVFVALLLTLLEHGILHEEECSLDIEYTVVSRGAQRRQTSVEKLWQTNLILPPSATKGSVSWSEPSTDKMERGLLFGQNSRMWEQSEKLVNDHKDFDGKTSEKSFFRVVLLMTARPVSLAISF